MPIILVIVPGSQAKIKELNQICDMEVRFEHQRRKKESGSATTASVLGIVPITAKRNQYVDTVRASTSREPMTRMMLAPTNGAIAGGHTNQITKDAPTFLQKKRRILHLLLGEPDHPDTTKIFKGCPRTQISKNYSQPWMS
ncbi:hypothetical protein JTB14_028870 [Gonioctena quinquepunctata]|nr:hypothetical protein JTB14_028870 [Gonioctena quinquepunctata]